MVLALIGVQTETVRKAVLRVEAHSLHGAPVLFDVGLLSDALVVEQVLVGHHLLSF